MQLTELFLRGRKLNISLVFFSQSYFKVPKTIRLNGTHHFIMEIPNRRELQQIALNHQSDIGFKEFVKFYKEYIKPYLYLVNDRTLSFVNPLRFMKKFKTSISEKIKTIDNKIQKNKAQQI